MEIVKHGTKFKEQKKFTFEDKRYLKCRNCDCIFIASEEEKILYNCRISYYYCECPECKDRVEWNDGEIDSTGEYKDLWKDKLE